MSTRRSNTKKRARQRKRYEAKKQKADLLLTCGLIADLAQPISSRGALSEAIRAQQQKT
jgi:hypothetical protein